MFSSARLTMVFAGLTVLLFQTHWIDDFTTAEPDVLGITVSAVGGALLVAGLLLRRRGFGLALLVLGFLFVALVSAADLRGVDTTGALAPDIVAHWRDGLGWGFTLAVALTLILSLAGMVVLIIGVIRNSPARAH
jgi:hypothetical protein